MQGGRLTRLCRSRPQQVAPDLQATPDLRLPISNVLEYLEGQTLAARSERGPLNMNDALNGNRDRRRARLGASGKHGPSRLEAHQYPFGTWQSSAVRMLPLSMTEIVSGGQDGTRQRGTRGVKRHVATSDEVPAEKSAY